MGEEFKKGASYVDALKIRLNRENLEYFLEPSHLSVLMNGELVGAVTTSGEMLCQHGCITTEASRELYYKTGRIATEVYEYMEAMQTAPLVKADGLNMPYRLLAEYNGCLLAGMNTQRGVQFATWEWTHDKTAVYQCHYYGENYVGAKEDFAGRSRLIQKGRQFTDEQLTEIYRCVADTLEGAFELTHKTKSLLENIQNQIQDAVPDLEERIVKAMDEEPESGYWSKYMQ